MQVACLTESVKKGVLDRPVRVLTGLTECIQKASPNVEDVVGIRWAFGGILMFFGAFGLIAISETLVILAPAPLWNPPKCPFYNIKMV